MSIYDKSEWEVVQPTKAEVKNRYNPSDWEVVHPISEEEEQRGFWGKLARDIPIAMAHGGRNFHNLPHDIAQGIEESTQPFGELFKSLPGREYYANPHAPISQYLPNDTMDYSATFGQNAPAEFPHNYIQKVIEYAPDLLLARNALKNFIPYLTKRGATKTLNKAQALSEEREIGKLNVDPELIEDARQFLPNLLRNRQSLKTSHEGDYNSLFKLQSNVGKISTARQGKFSKIFAPETHLKGQAGLESRNNLLNAIHENLQGMGHKDISDLLRKGQNEYRKYMKYRKYRNIIGGAAVAYAAPKNALTDLVKKIWSQGNQ